jgi:hypothetical protein
MEEVRDDDVDPAVIAGVRAELARLGYTDVPDDVIMAHVKGNIAKERARIAALAAAATPPLPPVPPPPAPSQLLTAAPPAEADAEATPAVGAASTTATPREAQASDPASAAPPPAPTGIVHPLSGGLGVCRDRALALETHPLKPRAPERSFVR